MSVHAQRRKKNRQIKRRKRIINALKFIIIVGAIYAFIFCTPFFNVKSIVVEGANVTSTQSVLSASGIAEGTHVLKVNKKAAIKEIEKLAYIKTAQVKRVFPNKIKIVVQEGNVLANIALTKGFAAIDEAGKIMEISDTPKITPVVYGLTVKKSEVGSKITIDEPTQLDVILKYANQLNIQALATPYVSLTLMENDIWAELENGVLVCFGDEKDIDYKVAAFAESLRSAGDISTGFFDVSSPDRIVYSTHSPFEEEAAEEEETAEAETETDEPRTEEE